MGELETIAPIMADKKKTARSAKTDYVLDDARHVLGTARKHQKEFLAADKGKKKVRVSAALLNGMDANIHAISNATSAVATSRARKEQATAIETKARMPLYETLIDIRDDIATIHEDDKAVQRAFGVGTRIDKNSTPILLKLASDILHSIESDSGLGKAAREAGINAARVTQLRKVYQALANAQETQVSAIAGSRIDSVDKKKLSSAIKKDTAFIRKVASVVFRKDPKTLKEFASTLPKRASRGRVSKKAATKASAPATTP
jgi:hypothetical protein